MNGRKNRVKSWMTHMHKEMNSTQDIFNLNLITSDDIGENNYTNIINQLDNIINLIEDILFELDNKG